MLKQFSSISLIILATSSLIIASENNPCDKLGWLGLKWACNGIWGDQSQKPQQKLPDVKVPSNPFEEKKETTLPTPVIKEETKTPNISLPESEIKLEELPTPKHDKIIVRSTSDIDSNKEEVAPAKKDDDMTTMRTFEVVHFDKLQKALKKAKKKSLIGKIKLLAPFLSYTLAEYCTDPEIKALGTELNDALHKDELLIVRTEKQIKAKYDAIKSFINLIIK